MPPPSSRASAHFTKTAVLAKRLRPRDIYRWLVTTGYFPEPYVLPPCFHVSVAPAYPKQYSSIKRPYPQQGSELEDVHFPKTDLTDRTFGIIHPEIHSDIAWNMARSWRTIASHLFHANNRVCSYSFPIPLDAKSPGNISRLRAGRLIYEWIEMVETDLTHDAYRYKCMVRTDIRNFYPSIYTHSISWALHTRQHVRSGRNRHAVSLLGNRLDRLFQASNDGCTNGIPIGPVVSDLIAEIILAAVDRELSRKLRKLDVLAVRFKDDYRFLCKTEAHGMEILKELQRQLAAFSLLLGEEKTEATSLPEGLFRPWRSHYDAVRPARGATLSWRKFRELYGRVLEIDSEFPGTGVVDRFIADLYGRQHRLRVSVTTKRIDVMLSLLMMLANRRLKSLPGILGAVEALMDQATAPSSIRRIEEGIGFALTEAMSEPLDNRYKIAWLLYFLKSNRLSTPNTKLLRPLWQRLGQDSICRTVATNRAVVFKGCQDFSLFRGVRASRKAGPLRQHVDVFHRQ